MGNQEKIEIDFFKFKVICRQAKANSDAFYEVSYWLQAIAMLMAGRK